MKTINIKGKEYVPVVERVKEFHKIHPQGWIETKIHESSDDRKVVVLAKVWIDDKRFFCGASQAEWGKGLMGAVALEVAETSAVGRALGFANIGLLEDIATSNEIQKNSYPSAAPSRTAKNVPTSPEIDWNAPDAALPDF